MRVKNISLKGKVILVTGASRGLGRALAIEYARRGAGLIINSRTSSQGDLLDTERTIKALGAETLRVQGDISNRADAERLAGEALARFQRVDVLVNNASALGPTPMPFLVDFPIEDFVTVLQTNLVGPFLLTRALVGPMIARKTGSVINVSSDAGVVGYPTWGAYGVSKAALDQLTRTWAVELEGTGVRVNSVDPGDMDTAMKRATEPEGDPSHWVKPEAVVPVFVYLASDETTTITGQRLYASRFRF